MKTSSAEQAADTLDPPPRRARSGPARIRAVFPGGRVELAPDGDDTATVGAQLAAVGYTDPRAGDRVLAVTDDFGKLWIVGVIDAPRTALLDEALASLGGGEDGAGATPVRVHDRHGALLFEYDPASDRAVLHVPSGDLEVSVPQGALRMKARDGVELATDGDVRLRGGRSVELEAARAEGPAARIAMQPGELSLIGSVLTVAADRAELLASAIGVKAHLVESHIDRVRNVVKVLDLRAGRIVERAKDVYRETEGLSQTRAGRLRMVAQKTVQIVGEDALLKARDRMKIKGERIHLA